MVAEQQLRVRSSAPGRARLQLDGGAAPDPERLRQRRGIRSATFNPRTGALLVRYDERTLSEGDVVAAVTRLLEQPAPGDPPATGAPEPTQAAAPEDRTARVRIPVRGLERDGELARRLISRLQRIQHVHKVTASPLTGRVLVEFSARSLDLQRILQEVTELEPAPSSDGEDELPPDPHDPVALIEGWVKTASASAGLALLAFRRARGQSTAPTTIPGPGELAGLLGAVESMPTLVKRLEHELGHERKELLFGALSFAGMTLAGSSTGLALAGSLALRLLSEARCRRAAWQEYEERVGDADAAYPGASVEVEPGERVPLPATVMSGFAAAIGEDGMPLALSPGRSAPAGARVVGGEAVTVRLHPFESFDPCVHGERRHEPGATYRHWVGLAALAYAGATAIATRSAYRAAAALLTITPRPLVAGIEAADRAAAARATRAGATVVGACRERPIRRPDRLLIASPRLLVDGYECAGVRVIDGSLDERRALELAAAISAAAGAPWGEAWHPRTGTNGHREATSAAFDGSRATAEIDGERWRLVPASRELAATRGAHGPDHHALALRQGAVAAPLALIRLRPRLAAGLEHLKRTCRELGVELELVCERPTAPARALADRSGLRLIEGDPGERVQALQDADAIVAVLGDGPGAARALSRADLGIGLSSGLSGRFMTRADLLAPNLDAVAALVEIGARRDRAATDALAISVLTNAGAAIWGAARRPRFKDAPKPSHLGGTAATALSSLRLAGGARTQSVTERLSDPRPERWGARPVSEVLERLRSTHGGLSTAEARRRRRRAQRETGETSIAATLARQLRSPLTVILGGGAALSLAAGAVGDVAMIGAAIAANAMVGIWQERQAGHAARALERFAAPTARVLRDGTEHTISARDLVPGDILILRSGERVAADARLLECDALTVDDAALTGESLPVGKTANGGGDSSRIVLDGSDVTTGSGRAVVVAVGDGTRLGSIAAALRDHGGDHGTPLEQRLTRVLWRTLPFIALGGLTVSGAGVLWGGAPLAQLALGATVALSAVPEGLPMLAGVAQAGVSQRLARRRAIVTRLAAVEALGRVDVACADKTGTLTTGKLEVALVAGADGSDAQAPDDATMAPALRDVLLAAALASPHPEAGGAGAHPTDAAVIEAARAAGLDEAVGARRDREAPFDPARPFHASVTHGKLHVKGAPEELVGRCVGGGQSLSEAAERLSGRGLRVLLVATGPAEASVEDPRELTALGFVGIADPLRPGVADTVQRCAQAGVRVVMVTGDHPATATAIARAAGLADGSESVVTAAEIAELDDDALGERLERASVIARSTPTDKVRIVSALRARGHVVAMTGDGVNDAPALRLADVGVAMGRHGTEVARQAADLILADDEFRTLAEALVEGRSFWRNMRRALGLLLGGNAGEVGLMTAASLAGMRAPLNPRQVLTVNVVTDVLPALAVAVQEPQHRELGLLRREGTEALDTRLRGDIVRRGVATALPSFGAYALAALRPREARNVAYTAIVTTQLAQTLDLGRVEGRLTPPVFGAAAASLAVVWGSMLFPPLRAFLGLSAPGPATLVLPVLASAASVAISRSATRR